VVRRDELAVVERERALRVVVEERVVERPRPLRVDLGHAGHEPDAVLARDLAEAVGRRAGHLDRLLGETGEGRLRARVGPAREEPGPRRGRIGGDERLREDDELRARSGRLAGDLVQAREARLPVEDDGLDLSARDGDGTTHGAGSIGKVCTLRILRPFAA
jgi:hypothetical protein